MPGIFLEHKRWINTKKKKVHQCYRFLLQLSVSEITQMFMCCVGCLQLYANESMSDHVGFARVFIELINENDNRPIFSKPLYNISLPENTASGTSLLRILVSVSSDWTALTQCNLPHNRDFISCILACARETSLNKAGFMVTEATPPQTKTMNANIQLLSQFFGALSEAAVSPGWRRLCWVLLFPRALFKLFKLMYGNSVVTLSTAQTLKLFSIWPSTLHSVPNLWKYDNKKKKSSS